MSERYAKVGCIKRYHEATFVSYYSTGQNYKNNIFLIFFYNSKHLTQIQIAIQIGNEELHRMHPIPKFRR
jgi:hypothetical protein